MSIKSFFNPSIKLAWKGHFGKQSEHYYPDTLKDGKLLRQFMQEANLNTDSVRITMDQFDDVLVAAGKHGYSITSVGGPLIE